MLLLLAMPEQWVGVTFHSEINTHAEDNEDTRASIPIYRWRQMRHGQFLGGMNKKV